MKTNLALLCVFLALLGVAYWTEQVQKKRPEYLAQLNGESLVIEQKMTELETEQFHLKDVKGRWELTSTDWPVSQNTVEDYLKVLGQVKVFNEMPIQDDHHWENPVRIKYKQGGRQFELELLGVSRVTGSMYFSHSNYPGKVLIGQFIGRTKDIYISDVDKNIKNYLYIKKLFRSEKEKFLELNFLKKMIKDKLLKIKVDNTRNRWFEVDFGKKQTLPIPYLGVQLKNLKKVIENLGTFKKVIKVHREGAMVLSDKRSEMTFYTSTETIVASLFLSLNGRYGNFFKVSGMKEVLEVELFDKNLPFSHVQMFWNKTFDYKVDFTKMKRFDFKLTTPKHKEIAFYIDDLEKFEVKSENPLIAHIDKTRMNFLFNLVFNLTDFKQAKYIRPAFNGPHMYQLKIELFNKKLGISIMKDQVMVDDLSTELQFVFDLKTQQVQSGFFEKIFTVKSK